jgi:hypothetical protein
MFKPHWHYLSMILFIGFSLSLGCAVWQMQHRPEPTAGEIVFSHKRHVLMDIECEYCHVQTLQSQLASDNTLPKEKDCMRCHKRTQGCELCHQDVVNAVALVARTYRAKFSHKFHLQLDGGAVGCTTCHQTISASTDVVDADQPTMKTCRTCHDSAAEDCTTCHDDLSADITFVPASHDSSWMERHRLQAAQNDELCAECHRGKIRPLTDIIQPIAADHSRVAQGRFCADCHRGDILPELVHENSYLQTHRLDARANSNACVTCHDRQECKDCHETGGFRYETVHPANFRFQHAVEAKRELTNCVTCHAEADCLGCHSTISPHPPGWNREMNATNEQLCLKCHVRGEL